MTVFDKIYGREDIKEPVLQELLKTEPVLRLKGISQFGMPNRYYPFKGFSRYEHSVGVMLLLGRLGASVEEQVAGLLHDVSHLRFLTLPIGCLRMEKEGKKIFMKRCTKSL